MQESDSPEPAANRLGWVRGMDPIKLAGRELTVEALLAFAARQGLFSRPGWSYTAASDIANHVGVDVLLDWALDPERAIYPRPCALQYQSPHDAVKRLENVLRRLARWDILRIREAGEDEQGNYWLETGFQLTSMGRDVLGLIQEAAIEGD